MQIKEFNLEFIDEEVFERHVRYIVDKYKKNIIKKFKTQLDPFKWVFDSSIYQDVDILAFERQRQLDKANGDLIGFFHQNIFKYLNPDWIVPEKGFDIINESENIFVEMKNGTRTMNAASSRATFEKMLRTVEADSNATCYLVQILSKQKTKNWELTIDGEKKSHPNILIMSGRSFYEEVTGNSSAYDQILNQLPITINKILKEYNEQIA